MSSTPPAPFTLPPTAAPHTHTVILLHGRGGDASSFALPLLFSSPSSRGRSLPQHFRHTKFVFPSAPTRRSTALGRAPIAQWFDNFSLADPEERRELQREGLAETAARVGALIGEEEGAVGAGRVVLGGLSQGCAAALVVWLGWGGESLGGFVGMSGWLPFSGALDPRGVMPEGAEEGGSGRACVEDGGGEEGGRGGGEEEAVGMTRMERLQLRAANTARDIALLPPLSGREGDAPTFAEAPVLLGHGRRDEKVSLSLGMRARDVLEGLGCDVEWKHYDEGHWYKVPEQIDDIVRFLSTVVGMENSVPL